MTATAPAATAAVAQELVALCRAGRNLEAIDKLYSPKIVSVESMSSAEQPAEKTGIDAIRAKNQWWVDNHDVHDARTNGPFVGENQFAVQYDYDVTVKATGARMQMTEMALYTVEDGKIVHEHFYYNMQGA